MAKTPLVSQRGPSLTPSPGIRNIDVSFRRSWRVSVPGGRSCVVLVVGDVGVHVWDPTRHYVAARPANFLGSEKCHRFRHHRKQLHPSSSTTLTHQYLQWYCCSSCHPGRVPTSDRYQFYRGPSKSPGFPTCRAINSTQF